MTSKNSVIAELTKVNPENEQPSRKTPTGINRYGHYLLISVVLSIGTTFNSVESKQDPDIFKFLQGNSNVY